MSVQYDNPLHSHLSILKLLIFFFIKLSFNIYNKINIFINVIFSRVTGFSSLINRHLTSDSITSRRQSLNLCTSDEFDLEYHATQLEHFLEEYRNLQEQLFRIKGSDQEDYFKENTNENRLR